MLVQMLTSCDPVVYSFKVLVTTRTQKALYDTRL